MKTPSRLEPGTASSKKKYAYGLPNPIYHNGKAETSRATRIKQAVRYQVSNSDRSRPVVVQLKDLFDVTSAEAVEAIQLAQALRSRGVAR